MDDIKINNHITIPASALKFKYTRSSGKGGQNVNKVSTKAELLFAFDEIRCNDESKDRIRKKLYNKLDSSNIVRIVSQESRSQWQNKQSAVEKLVKIISDASVEEKERYATKPTRSSKNKRVEKKKKEGQRKKLRQSRISVGDD
jgi:ribosome-associated protein